MYRSKQFMVLTRSGLICITLILLVLAPVVTQDGAASQVSQAVVLEGTLGMIHVDARPGSGETYQFFITLYQDDGTQSQLLMPATQAQRYMAQRVRVYGQYVNQPQSGVQMHDNTVSVGSISQAGGYTPQGRLHNFPVFGTLRDIMLLCHYADSTEDLTDNLAHFERLVSGKRPGVSHYWRTVSYDKVNLSTTEVLDRRLVLPQTRSSYRAEYFTDPNVNTLVNDCITAADPYVDFLKYHGIHLMLDDLEMDFALGGIYHIVSQDGTGLIRFTLIPPFAYRNQVAFAHEVGHTLGLLHSSGDRQAPADPPYPYDSGWDVMSYGFLREIDGTGDQDLDSEFDPDESGIGHTATGTISYNLLALGYMPANRVVTVPRGEAREVTLERLLLPTDDTTPLMVVLPINNVRSTGVRGLPAYFYTVEARFANDYDQNIPPYELYPDGTRKNTTPLRPTDGNILIHYVDSNATEVAAHVVDPDNNRFVNDEGAIWEVGETFTDSTHAVSVEVIAKTDTTFTVVVKNGTTNDPPPTSPATILVEPNQGRPTLTLINEEAQWFYVWMGNSSVTLLNTWFHIPGTIGSASLDFEELSCSGLTCTITPNINPLGGTYTAWTKYWAKSGYSIGGDDDGWFSSEQFTLPTTPPGPVTDMDANITPSDDAEFTWQGVPGATWYNIWVGTPNPDYDTAFFAWALAKDLGCENGGVCIFNSSTETVIPSGSLKLSAGKYIWYLQSWGPGGFSKGGKFAGRFEPWQTGTTFAVP